jgi:hypothetical protein
MLFDLTDPKTDVKALFESFREWAWIVARKVEEGTFDTYSREIFMKSIKFSEKDNYLFFKSKLVDYWIYYVTDKDVSLASPSVYFWKVNESRDPLIKAWEMACLITKREIKEIHKNIPVVEIHEWFNLPLFTKEEIENGTRI